MSRFQKHIFVCTNERAKENPKGCCYYKDGTDIREKFKEEIKALGISSIVRTNNSGCLDACEFGATVVIYPEAIWYGGVTEDDVHEIVTEHIVKGKVVDRLTIKDTRYTSDEVVKPLKR
jgi:(2Fe-2S) ferredoxin